MFQYFRVKRQPERVAPALGAIPVPLLERDPALPFTIRQLIRLPNNTQRRICRAGRPERR